MRLTLFFGICAIQILSAYTYAQCTDYTTYGVDAGSLTFNSSSCDYQTIGVDEQDYFTISVTNGNDYQFDFCGNGGSIGSLYPNMSLMNGATLITSDLWDGTCASITWTATFTGTVYLYITDDWDGCTSSPGDWSGTMAYNEDDGSTNTSFTMSSTSCTGADATITGETGGTFSFNPVPGDGATINSSTGQITNGVAGSTYYVDYTACGSTTNESVTLSATGSAAFTLNPSCGGAVPIVSGDQGGSFSFNPLPGDGAQISSSSGVVSNATAGTSYYVDYSVCGSTSSQSVTVIDDNCFTINGNAQYISVNSEQCIELTDELNDQTGCAWNGNQINFNSDFSLNLDYYFGTGGNNGADGNTFTFQPSSSSACGNPGGQLGAGGISNALVVEFDTYDNDNPSHVYDMSCDHIAVEIDGDMQNAAPYCGPVCAKAGGGNIDDGGTYSVEIAWDATTHQLDIYFDGNLRLSCSGDFVNTVFGGQNQVYWGATSATGGLYNQQFFCPSTVVILPVELSSFTSTCDDDREIFEWISETEKDLDYYELEYTYDGIVYYPVKQVQAVGTTDQQTHYSVSVESNDNAKRFYRLSIVDTDGRIENSELIASKDCSNASNNLIQSFAQSQTSITLNLKEKGTLEVYDEIGRLIQRSTEGVSFTINTELLDPAVYTIRAINSKKDQSDIRKFLLVR